MITCKHCGRKIDYVEVTETVTKTFKLDGNKMDSMEGFQDTNEDIAAITCPMCLEDVTDQIEA